jgi:hypothetical protein
MRKSIIITAIVVSSGLIASAQASDWSHGYDRQSSHVERPDRDRDDDGRRHERGRSRDRSRTVACMAAQGDWMSYDALRAKLTSAGYQVWSLKPDRRGCVEAKVTQANGWRTELYIDPATAEIKYRK